MNKLMVLVGAAMTALASFAGGEALVQLISQDGSTTNEYADLQTAFNASQTGDTVLLLADTGATGIFFDGKDVIFDLGGHTLSNSYDVETAVIDVGTPAVFDIKNSNFVVTNGIIDAVGGTAIRGVGGGNRIVIAGDGELTGSFAWMFYPGASTVDIYGRIVATGAEYPCVWFTDPGEVVNVYEGAELTSYGDVFRFESDCGVLPANPATLNVYGGTMTGSGYPAVFAFLYGEGRLDAGVVNVYGGDWKVTGLNDQSWAGAVLKKVDGMSYRPLDGECKARFSPDSGLAELCAEGYAPAKGAGGYYTIQKKSVQLVSKDGSTTSMFADLQAAFDAAKAGDTVRLLADMGMGGVTLNNKDVIFDLGGYTLTNVDADMEVDAAREMGWSATSVPASFDLTKTKLVVTNGVIDARCGTAIRGVGGNNTITLACDAELLGAFAWTFYPGSSTVDIYGKITVTTIEYPCVWLTEPGEVINVYTGAVLTSEGDVFRHRSETDGTPMYPAELNIYGGEMRGRGYPLVYAYLKDETKVNAGVVNIYGGTLTVLQLNTTEPWFGPLFHKISEMTYRELDDTCTAKFSSNERLADLCASGYGPVKGEDGYYTIQVLSDVEWPEAWPADADDAVKAKFADWSARNPGVDYAQDQVKNAFLMNFNVSELPSELRFCSIAVTGSVATVVVVAEDADLATFNGVISVTGSGDLADWKDVVVETPKSVEVGKATFEVEGAKFFKAVLDFKAPVPEN